MVFVFSVVLSSLLVLLPLLNGVRLRVAETLQTLGKPFSSPGSVASAIEAGSSAQILNYIIPSLGFIMVFPLAKIRLFSCPLFNLTIW